MKGSSKITKALKEALAQAGDGASLEFLVAAMDFQGLPRSIWNSMPYEKQIDTVRHRLVGLKETKVVTEVFTPWNHRRYFRLRRDDDYDSYIPLKEPPKTFS